MASELKRPLLELRQLALGLKGADKTDEMIRKEMVDVSERAMRQVDDLMKMRKLAEYQLEPVAVRAVCDDVLDEIAQLFKNATCKMRVQYSNRSRLVMANAELLKSIIYNFLLDATHYASEDTKAELTVRQAGLKVAVEVRDFGPALPIKIWREIKENVMNEPNDIAMRPGSSALGLYTAAVFSKYMHADVSAVRHRDGTSFLIKMPVSRQLSMWG